MDLESSTQSRLEAVVIDDGKIGKPRGDRQVRHASRVSTTNVDRRDTVPAPSVALQNAADRILSRFDSDEGQADVPTFATRHAEQPEMTPTRQRRLDRKAVSPTKRDPNRFEGCATRRDGGVRRTVWRKTLCHSVRIDDADVGKAGFGKRRLTGAVRSGDEPEPPLAPHATCAWTISVPSFRNVTRKRRPSGSSFTRMSGVAAGRK